MTKIFSTKKLKVVFTIFILSTASGSIFSQTGFQVLEGNALNDAVYQNVKNNRPQFEGMNDLYIITTDNMKAATYNSTQLTADIKAIQGVLTCSYDIAGSKVNVTFTKPNNKDFYNNDTHLAKLKEVLDHHGMRMIADKRVVIKK